MRLTGQTLTEQRLAIGASQEEMAKRAGVSRPTIIKYEKGIDLRLAALLEAYCLEVYPTVGSLPADISEIERIVKNLVKDNLGVDCKVRINVELFGGEEC